MVNWEGTQDLQLTYGPYLDSSPRWSPDGKFVAFLSACRAESKDRYGCSTGGGGEARQLTSAKGEIDSSEWVPDGKRLVLVMQQDDDQSGVGGMM